MPIGYARVSTHDQNLDLQIDALTKAGCEPIITDNASGASKDRPGLAEALERVGEGDVLVVWKLDRLGRSVKQLIETVQGLQERGAEVKCLQDNIDTTTTNGKLFFHIFAALAEFERDMIRDRTKAGLTAARARGRIGGRPTVLDKKKMAMVRTLSADRTQSVGDICKTLGISRSTYYRCLKQS